MKHSDWHGMLRLLPVLLLVGILSTGCGDDGGSEPDLIVVSDFEGPWMVTQYQATSTGNPPIVMELIAMGGAFGFDADDEGDFQGRAFIPASLAGMTLELSFQGGIELISQDTLLVDFIPQIPPFLTEMRGAFTLTSNTLTLYDPNAFFDFDGDQQMEPAIFEGALARNDGSYPPIIFTEDFEGHWEATGYTVTSVADPQTTLNTIDAGATFEFDVGADGTALVNAFIPASLAGEDLTFTDIPAAFQLEYQDTMTIAFTPEIPPLLTDTRGHFTLVGDDYTLTDEATFFDFGGGVEPAIAVVEIERTSGGK
jgi:hypothetical protein